MGGSSEAVIMLTRAPFDGSCKTRLSAVLDARQRQALSQAMLLDEVAHLRESGRDILMYCTPAGHDERMRDLVGADVPLFPQADGDLGQRMLEALRHAFGLGYSRFVLVGSDAPELSAQVVVRAFAALDDSDVVLVPTFDGGYCLVGMSAPIPEAFPPVRYGGPTVLEQTVAALERDNISYALFEPVHDIDTPQDLRDFVARRPAASCPHAWAFVQTSIEAVSRV